MVYVGTRPWKYKRMIMYHLIADSLEELHEIANKLGIGRQHFQDKPNQPHYDICKQNKAIVIAKYGAKETCDKKIVNILHEKYGPKL